MAKQSIHPERIYKVELRQSISVGRQLIAPNENLKLRGDILSAVLAEQPNTVANWSVSANIDDK